MGRAKTYLRIVLETLGERTTFSRRPHPGDGGVRSKRSPIFLAIIAKGRQHRLGYGHDYGFVFGSYGSPDHTRPPAIRERPHPSDFDRTTLQLERLQTCV